MKTIPLFSHISYERPKSCAENTLSKLSHYFYLGGARATVVKRNEIQLEKGQVSWKEVALKVASYILLFPITLTLLTIHVILRTQHHLTLINLTEDPLQPAERIRQSIIPGQKEVYHPFTIQVSLKSLPLIVSKEQMCLKAQEIGQQVLDNHSKLRINLPATGLERDQAMKFIEELKSLVDVIATRWSNIFYLVPKRSEETLQNLTIRKFNNGVIEEVRSTNGEDWTYWKGRRIYSDGAIETGDFVDFCLHKGTRLENQTTIYCFPTPLVMCSTLNRGLMYANIEGKKQLIVIQKKLGSEERFRYVQVKEELIPTLTEILKQLHNPCNGNYLTEILSGSIDCKEFIDFLFNTNSIFSLIPYSLIKILDMIQNRDLKVNLHQKEPETGQTLLQLYSYNDKILNILLGMDPTLIENAENAFVFALLSGNQEGAIFLFDSMEAQKILLSPQASLFKKIAFSEGEITPNELRSLSLEDLQVVYQLANIYSRLDIIKTLKALGVRRTEELIWREGPSIFGCNMDVLEMHECLLAFLKNLRSNQLLLTQTEFNQLSPENYIRKNSDIGRILGRDYIERKARDLGLKHIKVPRKMIVIDDENANLQLRTSKDLDIVSLGGIHVYAERIQKSYRKINSEEISELLCLFEKTGFSDISWDNFIVAKDGIYIIDTEFTNFWDTRFGFNNETQFSKMADIIHGLPLEEQQPLIDELNLKVKTYRQMEETLKNERTLRHTKEIDALENSGCIYGSYFTFPINELITNRIATDV